MRDPEAMRNLIVALAPGNQTALTLKRGQESMELKVSVGKRPGIPRPAEQAR